MIPIERSQNSDPTLQPLQSPGTAPTPDTATVAVPQFPGIHIPKPFSLEDQDPEDLNKLRDEVMERVHTCETSLNAFYAEHEEFANSWRMLPRTFQNRRPRGLFNSKVGETNRATNTLASMWMRMLTAADPYFQAVPMGLNEFGQPYSESDMFCTEQVLARQLQVLHYKRKLQRSLRSLALFGSTIVEEPFVTLPTGHAMNPYFEGTDFYFRSILQVFFDPFIFDMELSDYIATADYPTTYRLRALYQNNNETWNAKLIEDIISDQNPEGKSVGASETDAYSRILQRKQRAGYTRGDTNILELINYHGKLDPKNRALQAYWESTGSEDDITSTDWTVGILQSKNVVRLHPTPFGTWHHLFKTAHNQEFELEALGYGVGKMGKKIQRELDITQSRMNDILMFSLYNMWKVGRSAGLKANQLNIKPLNIVELDDIEQLAPIRPDLQALVQAIAMHGVLKEDFRTITGASTNLQAAITKATATEASLTQNEAVRGASITAEIIAETLVREHIETMHINNTHFLDNSIYVAMTGQNKGQIQGFNKDNLPKNVGFVNKVTTDKDFRPDRMQRLLELIQIATSVRNFLPSNVNIEPVFVELVRDLGIDPRKIYQQQPVVDQLIGNLRKAQSAGLLQNEVGAEKGGAQTGSGGQVASPGPQNMVQTPLGQVSGSPQASAAVQQVAA